MKKIVIDNLTIHIKGKPSREKIEEAIRGLRSSHLEFGITEATVFEEGVAYHGLYFAAIIQLIEQYGPEGYTSDREKKNPIYENPPIKNK